MALRRGTLLDTAVLATQILTEVSRVVLVNYVSNPGASDYTAVIGVGGGSTGLPSVTPATVRVKYLLADSVQEQFNITWYDKRS